MKKYLLFGFALISTLGLSQQVLKRITDTPTHTIVELFALNNGLSLPNTTGEQGVDVGISSEQSTIIFYNPLNSQVYSPYNASTITPLTAPNIFLGNGTFNFSYITQQNQFDFKYDSMSDVININILLVDGNADALEDSNTNVDLLYSKLYLPKVLENSNPIPVNLLAIINSRHLEATTTGGISSQRLGFSFDGTNWISQVLDPNGNAFDVLQEVGVDGQLLNLFNFEIQNLISIYPNPTNNFITIQNKENTTENFEYKIVDLTGRIVKIGNSKFNEQINIESLESGNYIIQIETKKGEKLTEKLIKN